MSLPAGSRAKGWRLESLALGTADAVFINVKIDASSMHAGG